MKSPRWIFTNFLVVMTLFAVAGCWQKASKTPPAGQSGGSAAEEDHHAHDGVHGGQVIELGSENYHAELIHDDATHKVGVYFLDSTAKAAAPVDAQSVTVNVAVDGQPSQYTLAAVPQAEDPAGASSYFEVVSEELCKAIDNDAATARLQVTIAGIPITGEIETHSHDH